MAAGEDVDAVDTANAMLALHLVDAFSYAGGERVPGQGGTFLRVRVDQVQAWTIGVIGQAAPGAP